MNRSARLLLALVSAAALAACGGDDGGAAGEDGARTVDVVMRDIAFAPKAVTVQRGETVTFVFENEGKLAHDAFVGDAKAQVDHEQEMRADDDTGGHDGHGEGGDALTVKPGKSGKLTHTFDKTGEIQIGCHQPGHYAGGMKITVNVV